MPHSSFRAHADRTGASRLQTQLEGPHFCSHETVERVPTFFWRFTSPKTSPGAHTPSMSPAGCNKASISWGRLDYLRTSVHGGEHPAVLRHGVVCRMPQEVAEGNTEDLPVVSRLFETRCPSRARNITQDPTRPAHHLFRLLPSCRRFRTIQASTTGLKNSFSPVKLLNRL